MELYDFLKHLNSGAPVYSDSEAFEYMHELSNEAMRITFRLNGSYHTPEGRTLPIHGNVALCKYRRG